MTTWDEQFTPRPIIEPRADVLETCWRIATPSRKVLTCTIVRDDAPGLDVRASFSDEDLIRSQRVAEIGAARELAEQWKQAVLAKGRFAETDPDSSA